MESYHYSSGIQISGNLSSDSIILFSDIFNLFPDSFLNLVPHLAGRYRLATYRDDGFSEDAYSNELRHSSLQGYADDLVEYLENNNISNITYVAHSVNGLLALLAGAKAPHLFERIILINSIPYLQYDSKTQYLCGFQAINADNLFAELIAKKRYNTDFDQQKNNVQLTDLLADSFSIMNIEKAKAVFDLLITTDCRKHLSHFEIPTIILQAGGDHISTTEAGYYMHRTLPNSQLVKLKSKGHLPHVIAPEEIIRAMELFMLSSVC